MDQILAINRTFGSCDHSYPKSEVHGYKCKCKQKKKAILVKKPWAGKKKKATNKQQGLVFHPIICATTSITVKLFKKMEKLFLCKGRITL